jgi:putative ABC transport system permease protein
MLVAAGLAVGIAGALALGRTLQGHLFGVTTTDPFVLAAVLAGTAVTALLACLSPARRAARIDPLECLNAQ